MEGKFQPSFIPKAPIKSAPAKPVKTVSFFSVTSLVIFLTVAAIAVGMFFYTQFLEGQIATKKAKIQEVKESFTPSLLSTFQRLDGRLSAGKEIINRHLALSLFFGLLEETTLQRVQFTDFTSAIVDGQTKVTMKGRADSFGTVALQSKAFIERSNFMKNPQFSSLDLDEQGNVTFTFTAIVDPLSIAYRSQGNTQQIPAVETPVATSTATSTSVTQ